MKKKQSVSTIDSCFIAIWIMEGIYFIVQPVLHNANISGIIWKIGIVGLALINVFHIRFFSKADGIALFFIVINILFGAIYSLAIADSAKLFSIVAFINLLLFIIKSNEIKIEKKTFDFLYWISIYLALLFTIYSFTNISNRVTDNGNIWYSKYFVFNLDNSNTAGMYLYAIYCLLLIYFPYRKKQKWLNIALMTALVYMIWRTEARTCIIATISSTLMGVFVRKRKLPNSIIIIVFLFPIIFVGFYLWVYNSGFENILIGDKSLFSGRQETFVQYLDVIKTVPQMLFGNIGQATFNNAHNAPLSIYCSTGIVGTVLYYYLIIKKTLAANKIANHPTNRMALVCILGFIIQTSGEAAILLGGFPGAPFICTYFLLAHYDFNRYYKGELLKL